MKYRQKFTILASATIALSVVSVACQDKFLEIPVTAQLDNSQLSSKAGIEGSLISVYAMLNGRGDRLASVI